MKHYPRKSLILISGWLVFLDKSRRNSRFTMMSHLVMILVSEWYNHQIVNLCCKSPTWVLHTLCTRGSKFWSSKVCEGGESREAYECRLTFVPPQFLFEIYDHVTQFVQKPTFDPLSNWSKTHFWSSFISSNWIKSKFSNN